MSRDDLYPQEEDLRNVLQQNCVACSLCTARNRISWGYGRVPCKLMLVGEAPAKGAPLLLLWKGANYTGIPFTNERSGATLRLPTVRRPHPGPGRALPDQSATESR